MILTKPTRKPEEEENVTFQDENLDTLIQQYIINFESSSPSKHIPVRLKSNTGGIAKGVKLATKEINNTNLTSNVGVVADNNTIEIDGKDNDGFIQPKNPVPSAAASQCCYQKSFKSVHEPTFLWMQKELRIKSTVIKITIAACLR